MLVIRRRQFHGGIVNHLLQVGIAAVSVREQQKQKTSKMNPKVAALKAHITDTVANFETVGKPFSAHDVTLSLRESLNNKLIELDDRPYEPVSVRGGSTINSQKLEHAEVRDLTHSMYDQGAFPNLEQDHSGGFITYRLKQPTTIVPVPSTSAGTTPTINSNLSVNVGAPPLIGGVSMIAAPAYTHFPKLDSLTRSAPSTVFRLKYDGRFLSSRKGRTAFKRRSDLTQAFKHLRPELDQAIQAGKAEIVSV